MTEHASLGRTTRFPEPAPSRPQRSTDPALSLTQLQKAAGNHAVVGLLHGPNDSGRRLPLQVQRRINISPAMYANGLGITPANLNARQLRLYLTIAVKDEVRRAHTIEADRDFLATFQGIVRQLNGQPNIPAIIPTVTTLVDQVNAVLHDQDRYYTETPNADTRYATDPKSSKGYKHSNLLADSPTWRDDPEMRSKVAETLGPLLPTLPQTRPRLQTNDEKSNLPLKQLTLAEAATLLPRPLINLIFDVRYQLEAAGPGAQQPVIDERTARQRNDRDRSPSQPGSLRSWHQDDSGKLPDNAFNRGAIPPASQALHGHYTRHSQSGAGASVREAAPGPQGFAEYTGTGSDWEHNTKVVLDYINKRVYLTVTHYQYWALIPPVAAGDPYTFWEAETQEMSGAIGRLRDVPRGDSAIMMSPWLEILF